MIALFVAFAFHHHAELVRLAHPICFLGKDGHSGGCVWYRSTP